MTVTPLQLAGDIVRRSGAKGRLLTNLSVQKLAYFCHGWHLALKEVPLVSERFAAWKFGPVLPSVYHKLKVFSSNPIPPGHPLVTMLACNLETDSASIVDRVLDLYGPYSGAQLVEMSHVQGGPWAAAWEVGASEIEDQAIKVYFKSLIKH
ncbi:MAG TPA: type II toxin-antitoxin system antitoxin SocA domain-containing protein [Trinickia sp.]